MQPRNVRNPSSRARSSIALAGAIPPHFASFTLTPGDDADQRVEVLERDRALVGDDRDRRPFLEPGEVPVGAGRERLLDQLDAERLDLGEQPLGVVARPAGVGVDADRPAEDRPDGTQRLEVLRAAELDLERREVGGAGGPLGDDRGLVDPDREVGRRDRRRAGRSARGPGSRGPCRRSRGARCRARIWRRRSSAGSPPTSHPAARGAVGQPTARRCR